ncbi:ComF family protein [Parafrigoribacterium humi]|uniref:ComF family protein n=1 Tax=Parafrigoribacterium humi TaxID=3144664 RepID=UPI0032EE4DCE
MRSLGMKSPFWRAVMFAARDALLDASAVLLPIDCAGCGAADRALCATCRSGLIARIETRVLGDGTRVVTALAYDGVVRESILAFKHRGRTDVARALAVPLAAAVEAAVATTDRDGIELAAVPSTRAAFRRRGYAPVAVLLGAAGLGRASGHGVLSFARDHAQQKLLDRGARQRNLVGAMLAAPSLHGRVFILVDDVVTTGATLEEAARAIRAAGGEVLCAVALADTKELAGGSESSRHKLVTSPDDGTTVSKRGAQVSPGSAGGDAPR